MIWKNIEEEKPLAYKTGFFYGKKTDKILVCDDYGLYHIAEMYQGFLDGHNFLDFYDLRGMEIKSISYWCEIESPF